MDALIELLISKYGMSPDKAEAYANQIVARSRGGDVTGFKPDTHEQALQGEALSNVARDTLDNYSSLTNFAETAGNSGRSEFPSLQLDYDARLLRSEDETRRRGAEALERKKGQEHGQALVDNELVRLANMLDYAKTTEAGLPKPLSIGPVKARPQIPVEVGPATEPKFIDQYRNPQRALGVDTLDEFTPPDPYLERLRRATSARQAMLGN